MSTIAVPVTARCVHCLWTSDHEPGDELQEIRDIHELIHPGGTVLVGSDPEEPGTIRKSGRRAPKSPPRKWTRDRVLEAIKAWADEHGSPPTSIDWLRSTDDHPTAEHLRTLFGTFSEAIVQAGYPRPKAGGTRRSGAAAAAKSVPPPTPPASSAAGEHTQTSGQPVDPSLVELAERFTTCAGEIVSMRARLAALEDEHSRLSEAIAEAIGK